jgi:hypothetical protein
MMLKVKSFCLLALTVPIHGQPGGMGGPPRPGSIEALEDVYFGEMESGDKYSDRAWEYVQKISNHKDVSIVWDILQQLISRLFDRSIKKRKQHQIAAQNSDSKPCTATNMKYL